MKRQQGWTLIEVLVCIAILGIIAAVVILNAGSYFGCQQEPDPTLTHFNELRQQPITSLNRTDLDFMLDYCMERRWYESGRFYQNQIIINQLDALAEGKP